MKSCIVNHQVDEECLSPIVGYESESFDRDIYLFGKNYLELSTDEETTLQTLLQCKLQLIHYIRQQNESADCQNLGFNLFLTLWEFESENILDESWKMLLLLCKFG